ncbi:AraC family transcriptional regulator [Tamlana sp. 2201CG12-4]|uniref:AraC family transcriptional regulator n=1 Tax=Tamlana sp. 2201CG12-4 TaxID=3112582 RepID=UPI002DBCA11F|nr:AraC family transcriptional regulator [Tamlana sp. 2201CG12-4]MEC3906708.1 AraC family transcriptional regulator [Tamlana sp. 2201CG12-4]
MKVFPFKIPKQKNEALVYQEDIEPYFYDKLHQHQEVQISLILEGEGTFVLGDSVTHFKSNDIFVIGSNLPHVFKSDIYSTNNSQMLSLFFNKDSFGDNFFKLKEFNSLNSFFNKSLYGIKLNSNKDTVKTKFLKLKNADKLERFIILFEILHLICDSKIEQLSSFLYEKNYSDNEGKRMSAVFEYTMNNFNQDISLDKIADVANMTSNAFCRYFKQRTNTTYFQFLTKMRIENACKLLNQNSDLTIAEIAYKSGFKNISNFNRQFKQLKKTSPLKYKSEHLA